MDNELMDNDSMPVEDVAFTDTFRESKMTRERVMEATRTLNRYKDGKSRFEKKLIENEKWYRLRHYGSQGEVNPSSAWLLNCILNKHAAAMDSYPSANILPREEGDKDEAKTLSSIIPVILDLNDFEETYSKIQMDRNVGGAGAYHITYDFTKLNGMGDISIREISMLNLFWEPGINDIQESRNVFLVTLVDNDLLQQEYPQTRNMLSRSTLNISQYAYDESIDTSGKSAVVDWYYKTKNGSQTVLHYCKFVNDIVLYSSEDTEEYAERGFYDHGMFPFVIDAMYPIEGSPAGFGNIDIGKWTQEYIDKMDRALIMNMLANAKPRMIVRTDAGVRAEDIANTELDIVTADGALGKDSVVPMPQNQLPSIYVQMHLNKIDELKETTGNRDVTNGGAPGGGVTASSAIAAMQEAGARLDRATNRGSYRAYKEVIVMVIELIRQFYTLPRTFRILGSNGAMEFVNYSNRNIQPAYQGNDFGVDMGYRKPEFDVEVVPQKASPYSKMAQNELALSFYNAGFFNPQMADQALMCLDMMDFDHKDFVQQKVAENGGMFRQMVQMQQQMLQMAEIIDRQNGTNMAAGIAASVNGAPVPTGRAEIYDGNSEPIYTRQARERFAEASTPT